MKGSEITCDYRLVIRLEASSGDQTRRKLQVFTEPLSLDISYKVYFMEGEYTDWIGIVENLGYCHSACLMKITFTIFVISRLFLKLLCILIIFADHAVVFIFVGDANANHSEWLESVSPTDRHGRNTLYFCNLSGCEQFICCTNNQSINKLDLVMTDASDRLDVVVGTPVGTSDHCCVSCVEQSVPEYSVRSTVFLSSICKVFPAGPDSCVE